MPNPGWIKVWRKLRDNWVWRKKPYSAGQAWLDLLLRCNFSERAIPNRGNVGPATLKPGEAIVSLRRLLNDWGWSQNRVIRFLKALENESMIKRVNEGTFTRVKVLNWKQYQGDDTDDGSTYSGKTKAPTAAPSKAPPAAPPKAPTKDIRRRIRRKEGEEGKEQTQIWPPPGGKDQEAHQLTQYAREVCHVAGKQETWENDLRAALERQPVERLRTWLAGNKGKDVIALRDWLRYLDKHPEFKASPQAKNLPPCPDCKGIGQVERKEKRRGQMINVWGQCGACAGSGRVKEQVPK